MLFSRAALTVHRASLLRRGSRHGVYALQVAAMRPPPRAQQHTCATNQGFAALRPTGANLLPPHVPGFVPGAAQTSTPRSSCAPTARYFSAMRPQPGGTSSSDGATTGAGAGSSQGGAEGERQKGDG